MAPLRCHFRCLREASVLLMLFVAATAFAQPAPVIATSTGNYYSDGTDVFDDWDICRTRAGGADGFLSERGRGFDPVIVGESLGSNTDAAYVRGFEFETIYSDVNQRADAIFRYVRDRVHYTPDRSQFGYDEFAQNADELLAVIDKDGLAYGDCEDYAILLNAMYVGAGLRSAMVLAPDHAAALVYLPDYPNANRFLTVNGETGWIWAEATGGNNPLGWMPEDFMGTRLLAHELENQGLPPGAVPDKVVTTVTRHTGGPLSFPLSPFFLVILVLWLIISLGRRRSGSLW